MPVIDSTVELIKGNITLWCPEDKDKKSPGPVECAISRLQSKSTDLNAPMPDEKNLIPAGTARVLYKKMLDYLNYIAEQSQYNLRHDVSHEQELGLNPEKWDQVFKPILQERGYREKNRGKWVHLYRAGKSGQQ